MGRGVYLGATARDVLFIQSPLSEVVRNATWEPVHFGTLTTVRGNWSLSTPGSTTIAAGSHLAVLPQPTIFLASVDALDVPASATLPEYVAITIGGKHTVVSYTGINVGAKTITGCAGGTGTMSTGDAVTKGQVAWQAPPGSVASAVAEVAFAANATNDRGIRFRFIDGLFNFPAGTKTERACATQVHHIQSGEQPAFNPAPGQYLRIECFQDSGAALDIVFEALSAPRIVAIPIGALPT